MRKNSISGRFRNNNGCGNNREEYFSILFVIAKRFSYTFEFSIRPREISLLRCVVVNSPHSRPNDNISPTIYELRYDREIARMAK